MNNINRDLVKEILKEHNVDVSLMNDIILIFDGTNKTYKINKNENCVTLIGSNEIKKIDDSCSYLDSDWEFDILEIFENHDNYLLLITIFPFNDIDKQFIILDKKSEIK